MVVFFIGVRVVWCVGRVDVEFAASLFGFGDSVGTGSGRKFEHRSQLAWRQCNERGGLVLVQCPRFPSTHWVGCVFVLFV